MRPLNSLLKVCIIFFTSAFCTVHPVSAQIDPLTGIDVTGLYIPATLTNTDASARRSYIYTQRSRTHNRTLLDLAMNYAPISFISGWYLDPFKPKEEPYIINAEVNPQFAIGGEWSPLPILISPRYKVRILGEDSSAGDISLPVRTPSYMPGGTVFWSPQQLLTPETRKVYFFSLSVFHHSNGQDGAEFLAPGVFNKYNGNFSTNYVEPAVWYRHRFGGGIPAIPAYPGARYPYFDLFGKLGYEINFATAKWLDSTYGSGRLNLNGGLIHVRQYRDIHPRTGEEFNQPYYREQYRILFNSSFVTGYRGLDLGKFSKRINVEGSFHYRITNSPNTAGMLAIGYYGNDPYNIYYEDSYAYIRIGLSAGLFVAPPRR